MPVEEIEHEFPNARRHFRGCVFISHAGADTPIFDPVGKPLLLDVDLGPYGVFRYNSRGGGKGYKSLVLLALTYCSCAIVVCSKRSAGHDWVFAEVDWLLDHDKPIFILSLDQTDPRDVHPKMGFLTRLRKRIRIFEISQAPQIEEKIKGLRKRARASMIA